MIVEMKLSQRTLSRLVGFPSFYLVLLVVVHAFGASALWADSDEAKPSTSKAIEAIDQAQGFKLRETAAQTLGIKFSDVDVHELTAEPDGVVRFQDFVAVYRRRGGWIKMVEVEGKRLSDGRLLFASKEFRVGDQIAVQGAPALRVIDMDLWGPKADACGD